MAIFIQSFTLTGGESPSGTLVTTTSQQIAASQTTGIVSAAGPWDVWALTAGQQISRNGLVDPNSGLVTKLYYNNHTLYQFNGTNWYYYNTARSTSTTFSWNLVVDPTAAVVPNVWNPAQKSTNFTLSSDGLTATLVVTTAADQSVFAKETTPAGPQCSLIYWEVVFNGVNNHGEVGIGTNSSPTGTYLGADGTSLGWRGDAGFVTVNNVLTFATWATYATGARLGFALDLVNGKLWGRVGGGNWNNDVIANQNPATNVGGAVLPTTLYVSGSSTVFVVPATSLFNNAETVVASFEPASWLFAPPVGYMPWSAAVPVSTAVSIQSVVLSGNKSFVTGTVDAVVGTIAVTLSSGTFTGTLGLSGADAASFKIVNVGGVNNLETNGALNVAKTYSVAIVATQAGATNSPFTSATQSIVGSATFVPTAPTIASNAGFNTLSFNDDFTTQSIATSAGAASGFKWYWSFAIGTFMSSSSWSINTTQTAANVPIVTSAGPNASPNGGILNITEQRQAGFTGGAGNQLLTSFPGRVATTVPANGNGVWQHCYFEAYIATDPNALGTSHSSSEAFPAFWAWGAEGVASFAGSNSPLNATTTEIDFLEETGGVIFPGFTVGDPAGKNDAHVANPAGAPNGQVDVFGEALYPTNNSEWHTYGCLWTPNNVTFYKDGVHYGTSANTTGYPLENHHLFMVLGSGINWPMYVDWVRVWTA